MKKFKPYQQHQRLLLPPSLDELIGPTDLVRVVNEAIDRLDQRKIESYFAGGGRPSYHPLMILKLLVYAYTQKVYSSRQIEKATRQNVTYMWLSGMEVPDFNTLNRFRSTYLKEVLEYVFGEVLGYLLEAGYVKGENYFIDGTFFEADANKYSAVWKKNTKRYKEIVRGRVKGLLEEIAELNEAEDKYYDGKNLPEYGEEKELDSEAIKEIADKVNEYLGESEGEAEVEEEEQVGKALKSLEIEAKQLKRYEEQEEILGKRNSYSKTDREATFMRLKDKRLRASYNVQVGTENGFICGISVHQRGNDGVAFVEHMKERERLGLVRHGNIVGDSIYGTEENYDYLEKEGLGNYLKYPTFHRELKKRVKPYSREQFKYDESRKSFKCPEGKELKFKEMNKRSNVNGYESESEVYRCSSCSRCQSRSLCTRGPGRTIQRNVKLDRYKESAKENLLSPVGIALRKRRGNEVESVFGDFKHNQGYLRIRLRGLTKAKVEMWLMALSYNLRKLHKATNFQPA